MGPPTAYTHVTLKMFLTERHPDMMGELGWDETHPVLTHIVNAALRVMHAPTVESVIDVARLELVVIREMWSAMAANLVSRYNNVTPAGTYSMEPLYEHALKQLEIAEILLARYDQNVLETAAVTDGDPVPTTTVQVYEIVPYRTALRW